MTNVDGLQLTVKLQPSSFGALFGDIFFGISTSIRSSIVC
jgi:hypothetical protein